MRSRDRSRPAYPSSSGAKARPGGSPVRVCLGCKPPVSGADVVPNPLMFFSARGMQFSCTPLATLVWP
jgi:hypothetical protein